jgi:hypothetical protein
MRKKQIMSITPCHVLVREQSPGDTTAEGHG